MNLATLLASSAFATGFALIVLQDYTRASRALRSAARPRVLRARAQFRPLPLSIPVAPHGTEIRP
eukprot:gene66260-90690_t